MLNEGEQKLLSAIKNVLKEDTALQDMLSYVKHDVPETSHHSQTRWEGIDDAFVLKVDNSPFKDAITSAFFQVHAYKYIDHPTFKKSFLKELTQRAVPTKETEKALKHVDSLIENPGERDSGWNPNLDEIVDITSNADNRKAESTEPFTGGGLYPKGDTYDKGKLEGFQTSK